jgi:MFS family permease
LLAFDWRIVTGLLVLPALLAIGHAFRAEFDETAAASTDGGRTDGDTTRSPLASFVGDSAALFTAGFVLALLVVMMNGLFYRGTLTFLPDVLSGFLPATVSSLSPFEPGTALAREFDFASYVYAGLLTLGIGGQYVGGKLTDRVPVTLGLAGAFAGLAVIAVAFIAVARTGVVPMLVVSALLGFLLFVIQPLYQATIAEYSPPDDRGLSYGYTYLANFGVGAAGAAIAGYLLTIMRVELVFVTLSTVPLTGFVLVLALRRVGK